MLEVFLALVHPKLTKWLFIIIRANSRDCSGIGSPQVAQNGKVVQNDRANGRDCSGIGSPKDAKNAKVVQNGKDAQNACNLTTFARNNTS